MQQRYDERDLYTGLASVHWATISVTDPRRDQEFYRSIIVKNSGKALELGCGAGRLLIAYLQDGLDVEGIDISADQLTVCRQDAKRVGVEPVLYEQSMQTFDVPHSYSTVYIPCGSFECVMDRAEALETLRRCFTHLEPKGQLVFACSPGNRNYYGSKEEAKTYPGEWTLRSNKALPDGRRLLVYLRDTGEDPVEQIQMQERRYEVHDGDQVTEEEVHVGQTRWYHRNEVLWMLQLAGFADVEVKGNFSDEPLNAEHTDMVFVATKPAG
ncbi:MAG: class I SAM-dependent methyltransferase [Gemmatimonadetes bacterium]|nr:class I SAM-dependent methyltransferase [Gemmatimonadota bacterium]